MSASIQDGTLRRYIDLPIDDIHWLEETYGKNNVSRILTMLLSKFKEKHIYTPQQLAEIGSEELKKALESGEIEL